MASVRASLRYARDIGEVLFLSRFRASSSHTQLAGDATTTVRTARFHAHARIRSVGLDQIVSRLSPDPVREVTLAGPRDLAGVGNATYYHALAAITRAISPSRVLEIGTYLGVGTLTIALNAPSHCRVVTVDLPDDASIGEAHGLGRGDLAVIGWRGRRVGEAFQDSRVKAQIEEVRADSLTWRPPDALRSVDLVVVDGGHSASIIRADTENAFNVVSPTGVIVWDDYFYLFPDVVEYLDTLADQGRRLHAIRGTNLVVYTSRIENGIE